VDFPLKTIPGQIAGYLTTLAFGALWVTIAGPRNWAVTIPDAAHTYGIRLRGSDLFFHPVIGWYIEHGLRVCLALVVVTVIAEALGRAFTPLLHQRRQEQQQ
jgi:hypothetical protein